MALIKDIATIKLYNKIGDKLPYEDLNPAIELCQTEYLYFYLGKTLTDLLNTYHNTNAPTPNANYTALLPYVQKALTHFALARAKSDFNVNMTSAGFTTQNSTNFVVASKDRTDDFYTAQMDMAYASVEALLNYMVTQAAVSDFSSWLLSEGYVIATELFIRTRIHLSQLTNWPITNTGYNTAREALRYAQFNLVQTVLGADLTAKIITLLNSGALFNGSNPYYLIVYRKACTVIAYGAMLDMAQPGDMYKETYMPRALNYQSILQKYLDDTATDAILPEYYNSGLQDLNETPLGYTNESDSQTLKFV